MGRYSLRFRHPLRCQVVASVLLASGCAITEKTYERDGVVYGVVAGAFRGKWYNYYDRALSYLDGGYTEDGIARPARRCSSPRTWISRPARTTFSSRQLISSARLMDIESGTAQAGLTLSIAKDTTRVERR